MKAYHIEESILYKGHFKICLKMEIYNEMCADGPINSSFNILASRLMGMPNHIFLQYIRQEYNAELHGKVGRYISYSFPKRKDADTLIEELNKRWNVLQYIKNGKPDILDLDVYI